MSAIKDLRCMMNVRTRTALILNRSVTTEGSI